MARYNDSELSMADGPIISSVGPSVNEQLTVSLYESAALECQAVGNPPPTYQWLHRTLHDGQESIAVTSHERFLHITNVTYEFQVNIQHQFQIHATWQSIIYAVPLRFLPNFL